MHLGSFVGWDSQMHVPSPAGFTIGLVCESETLRYSDSHTHADLSSLLRWMLFVLECYIAGMLSRLTGWPRPSSLPPGPLLLVGWILRLKSFGTGGVHTHTHTSTFVLPFLPSFLSTRLEKGKPSRCSYFHSVLSLVEAPCLHSGDLQLVLVHRIGGKADGQHGGASTFSGQR